MAMLLQYNTLHGEDAGETSGPSSAPVLDPPTIDLLPCHIPPPPPLPFPSLGANGLWGESVWLWGNQSKTRKHLTCQTDCWCDPLSSSFVRFTVQSPRVPTWTWSSASRLTTPSLARNP